MNVKLDFTDTKLKGPETKNYTIIVTAFIANEKPKNGLDGVLGFAITRPENHAYSIARQLSH